MTTLSSLDSSIRLLKPITDTQAAILTPGAIQFVASLERSFRERRAQLLSRRQHIQTSIDRGNKPGFLAETANVRTADWQVAPTPADLQKRHVEITGPTERKMLINALNSGADVFMADFEDANSPTWENMLEGQQNLREAVLGIIRLETTDGKVYELNPQTAVLMVRPRGWHLDETHLLVDDQPVSGSIFDFALYFYHNARDLLAKSSGPYFYLPKLESHLEARLWNDVFVDAQSTLGIPVGSIRATVLIETILAAFEMEEILYELRQHAAGLNAGRWDYIFSIIKKFNQYPDATLPDRSQVTMTVPFMRAYTNLLVHTCHKRGAHAIGGMAAYIPSRKDAAVNERALDKVREDKLRESKDGFDGTWVAHPDLVPVARDVFSAILGQKVNQKDRLREDGVSDPAALIDFSVPGGTITESGVRHNLNVSLQYLSAWLNGRGAVAIYNLMEDTATAEIARAQIWQWIHHKAALDDGRQLTLPTVLAWLEEEIESLRSALPAEVLAEMDLPQAASLVRQLLGQEHFIEFLTLPGSRYLEKTKM